MSLAELAVQHFRSVEKAELSLDPGHNLIWGANAAGKTSVLEAIYLLGRGRSFRTRNSERLIRRGQGELVVFGRTEPARPHTLGVQVSRREGTTAKADGMMLDTLAELSRIFPVQVIDPSVHRLIEEGGGRRRRWLGWGVFHVEPTFMANWSRYHRALKQRNAALKRQPDLADVWNAELAHAGELLAQARAAFIARLQPYWTEITSSLLNMSLELAVLRGWASELSLSEALDRSSGRDRLLGVTHTGPHRADISLKSEGRSLRDVLSRGQQKLAAAALILAQLRVIREAEGVQSTLLLDDPAAELDRAKLRRFIHEVTRLDCQLVFTSLDARNELFGGPTKVFHVEQGRVQEL